MTKRLLLTLAGLILLTTLLYFGHTETKQSITPLQAIYVDSLENSITRGNIKEQKIAQYNALAAFWKDSAHSFIAYAFYLSEASILDNSEKNLTFAARLLLDSMRTEENPDLKGWEAERSAELFEKAIVLDPGNDDLKVSLGSCYVYGKGMAGDAAETMKGIQQLLQVVRKDSGNMRAQLVLGVGGVISRQYDKAIDRLKKVVAFDGKNLEAVSWLADAYAAKGDKENAVQWYQYSKKLVNDPAFSKAVDERIKQLR